MSKSPNHADYLPASRRGRTRTRTPTLPTPPDLFGDRGKNDPLEWAPAPEHLDEIGELAAAYYQHLVVYQLKRALEDRNETVEDLARIVRVTPETLRRKFRGEDRAALEEITAWAIEYGIDLLPVIEGREDLLP